MNLKSNLIASNYSLHQHKDFQLVRVFSMHNLDRNINHPSIQIVSIHYLEIAPMPDLIFFIIIRYSIYRGETLEHLPIPAILLIAAYVEVIMTARIEPFNNIWFQNDAVFSKKLKTPFIEIFLVLCALIWRQRTLYMNELFQYSYFFRWGGPWGMHDLPEHTICIIKKWLFDMVQITVNAR